MKKKGVSEVAHTPRSSFGVGDYYGTGVRNPMGRVRGDSSRLTPEQLKKPPRSLA